MDFEAVDFLKRYLDRYPALRTRLRADPPSVRCGKRWVAVRRWRLQEGGIRLKTGAGKWVALDAPGRLRFQRSNFRPVFLKALKRHQHPWRIERVQTATDRNRHQTAAFLRVLLCSRGQQPRWRAVLAAYPEPGSEMPERLLTSALLWWDRLCASGRRPQELRFYLPSSWSRRVVELFPHLTLPIACFSYRESAIDSPDAFRKIYPLSLLSSQVRSPYVIYPYAGPVPTPLKELQQEHPDLELLYRKKRWELSWRGYPLAWQQEDGLWFGRGPGVKLQPWNRTRLEHFINELRRLRNPLAPHPERPEYRWGPERWLESLLLQDHRLIDPEFGEEVYSQVPTDLGGQRQVIDALTVTRQGRLAVIEIKAAQDLGLLFQGVDYWDRVQHHLRRRDFQNAGYFPGRTLTLDPPLLYLVAPLFDFHRVNPVLRRYLSPQVPLRCVGINSDWRKGVRVLRRSAL
ncbi:MAG: hypothetical protein V3T83_08305 [Acidobacteriota bacterium]